MGWLAGDTMRSTAQSIRIWGEMVKFSHSIFAMPFALMAAFLAGSHIEGRGWPHLGQLGLIILCMVAARSAAMTFNRIVDAKIDARNPRTSSRPLPAGKLTTAAAWAMLALSAMTFGVGCLGFFVFYHNTWPILASGPVLGFLCGYSFTKRFTKWSHYYLGFALALSPLATWIAVDPHSIGWPVVFLMLAVTFWVGGFDVLYSCQDIDIDREEKLHSLPSRLGPTTAIWIARLSHVFAVVSLVALGLSAELGSIYAVGVALAAILLLVENIMVRPGKYDRINVAFFTMNGIVSIMLGASAIVDVLLSV